MGTRLKNLESREISCVHHPKVLIVSVIPGYKKLMDWICCLDNIVINRLLKATSQSTNERRAQTLGFDTNELAVIRGPTLH